MLRRLVSAVLLLVGVTVITFLLANYVPSNPVLSALGETGAADPAAVAAYRERTGLDEPLPVQYLTYVENVLHGDFGTSRRSAQPIRDELGQYAPASIELAIVAGFLALAIGVTAGTLAAVFHDRAIDQVIRVFSLLGVSMPTFWLALVAFYVLSYKLGLFPGGDRLDPGMLPPPHVTGMYTFDAVVAGQWDVFRSAVTHLLLPAMVLAAYAVSLLTRFTRSAVLDVLGNDYVRTARAKGLGEWTIAFRHVLRAALVPIVTVTGVMFGVLLSGTVFVESIFAFPGLGQYAYLSATSLDLPAVMGISLFVAALYILINLGVDLLYGVIDPRIRLK